MTLLSKHISEVGLAHETLLKKHRLRNFYNALLFFSFCINSFFVEICAFFLVFSQIF